MGQRTELHNILCRLVLGATKAKEAHVYFQPPESLKLEYPCIVYSRDQIESRFANNRPYAHNNRYTLTVIDRDPESAIPPAVADLPLCSHDRHFINDNLHHDTFTIYY